MIYEIAIFFIIMIFEIVNTVLLLCSLMLNIKILNIANKMQSPKVSLADIAADMMSCDNCDSCESHGACNNDEVRNSNDRNDENINVNLLGNNKQGEPKEWTEIQIVK